MNTNSPLLADPLKPPPNPPPYGFPPKPPPWLKVWDEAPALAALPEAPNPPNCGAANAAAIKANNTIKNFMIKLLRTT